ncbi:hypothetical protein SKAU_G00413800 [Synaphobranchus kaupii]|uniref:Uncharacterized protein n=1 Tax=Synaphobranchus kaupii TaxID=118154 RepID=A0A9Q1E6Z3_SYNKA|nr:hypothetical protein SKAU_G00413800 [Synaphobranchus kaupii]
MLQTQIHLRPSSDSVCVGPQWNLAGQEQAARSPLITVLHLCKSAASGVPPHGPGARPHGPASEQPAPRQPAAGIGAGNPERPPHAAVAVNRPVRTASICRASVSRGEATTAYAAVWIGESAQGRLSSATTLMNRRAKPICFFPSFSCNFKHAQRPHHLRSLAHRVPSREQGKPPAVGQRPQRIINRASELHLRPSRPPLCAGEGWTGRARPKTADARSTFGGLGHATAAGQPALTCLSCGILWANMFEAGSVPGRRRVSNLPGPWERRRKRGALLRALRRWPHVGAETQ